MAWLLAKANKEQKKTGKEPMEPVVQSNDLVVDRMAWLAKANEEQKKTGKDPTEPVVQGNDLVADCMKCWLKEQGQRQGCGDA